MNTEINRILFAARNHEISVEEALLQIKEEPFSDIDFAKMDSHRAIRQGILEVIYSPGKTKDQLLSIVSTMVENGQRLLS